MPDAYIPQSYLPEQLEGTRLAIDLTEYQLAEVDRILGIILHMVGPIPQPAAV